MEYWWVLRKDLVTHCTLDKRRKRKKRYEESAGGFAAGVFEGQREAEYIAV